MASVCRATIICGLVLALHACTSGGEAEPGPALEITVAPLELPGVTNASYRLQVFNGSDQTVVDVTIDADRYGDGEGSVSYIAPCDAADNDNEVALTLLELRDEAGPLGCRDLRQPGYADADRDLP